MNINCIVFVNGSIIWITPEEFADLNFHLLNGDKFIEIPRIRQTYNVNTIAYVGANSIFLEDRVKDGQFSFAPGRVFALVDGTEYEYLKYWKRSKDTFSLGKSFDDYIVSQTVEVGDADPVNNTKIEPANNITNAVQP